MIIYPYDIKNEFNYFYLYNNILNYAPFFKSLESS